jgi:hypothetical protein
MQRITRLLLLSLLALGAAAYAGDQPKLTIESPQNGANIAVPAGTPSMVLIRFRTDDFKIVSLKDAMKNNDQQNAQVSSMNDTMSATNASPSPAGAAPGGPAPTGGAKQDELRPAGAGDLPQSDQPASAAHASMDNRSDRGHIHVTLDNQNWFWVHSTSDPIEIVGVAPGQHTVKLDLVGNNHRPTGVSQTVTFNVGGSK